MKHLLFVVIFLVSVAANSKDVMTCVVVDLIDGNFMDTGLNQVDDGDEDYSYISLSKNRGRDEIRIGGFSFPRKNSSDEIMVEERNGEIKVTIHTENFGEMVWTHSYTNGCSYLYSGRKTIARTNCSYDQGFDPCRKQKLN